MGVIDVRGASTKLQRLQQFRVYRMEATQFGGGLIHIASHLSVVTTALKHISQP
jgi:hypothetical protein